MYWARQALLAGSPALWELQQDLVPICMDTPAAVIYLHVTPGCCPIWVHKPASVTSLHGDMLAMTVMPLPGALPEEPQDCPTWNS